MKTINEQIIEKQDEYIKFLEDDSHNPYQIEAHQLRDELSALKQQAEKESILNEFANKIGNQKDIDPEIRSALTPEFFRELMKESTDSFTTPQPNAEKELQKSKLIEVIEADEKDGLYEAEKEKITDEDIEKWAEDYLVINKVPSHLKSLMVYAAKAMRDGLIKPNK